MSENIQTWALYAGEDRPDVPWLLHPCDVWVANPHYEGKPAPHPEDGGYDDDAISGELPEKDQPWRAMADCLRNVADTGTWDDEPPQDP